MRPSSSAILAFNRLLVALNVALLVSLFLYTHFHNLHHHAQIDHLSSRVQEEKHRADQQASALEAELAKDEAQIAALERELRDAQQRASRSSRRLPHPAASPPSAPASRRSVEDLDWAALAECESSGNPRAVSSSGRYYGLYQFDLQTWISVGGSSSTPPSQAPPAEQTLRAQILYSRRGSSPWPNCGRRLYS